MPCCRAAGELVRAFTPFFDRASRESKLYVSYPRSLKSFLALTLTHISKPLPCAGTPCRPPFAVSVFTFAFVLTSCPSWRSRRTPASGTDHSKHKVLGLAHAAFAMRAEKQFKFWRFCTSVITNAPSASTSGIGGPRRASLMKAPANRAVMAGRARRGDDHSRGRAPLTRTGTASRGTLLIWQVGCNPHDHFIVRDHFIVPALFGR